MTEEPIVEVLRAALARRAGTLTSEDIARTAADEIAGLVARRLNLQVHDVRASSTGDPSKGELAVCIEPVGSVAEATFEAVEAEIFGPSMQIRVAFLHRAELSPLRRQHRIGAIASTAGQPIRVLAAGEIALPPTDAQSQV